MDNRIKEKMKKGLAMVMTICMVLTMVGIVPGEAKADDPEPRYGGGDGSEGSPWEIKDLTQWGNFIEDVKTNSAEILAPNNHFKLKVAIDLSSYANWAPIENFTGVFDGGNMVISNMKITAAQAGTVNYGLFGNVTDSEIKNVTIKNSEITINSPTATCYAGMIVASGTNVKIEKCTTENCTITYATGTSTAYLGGIIGNATGDNAEVTGGSSACMTGTKIANESTETEVISGGVAGSFEGKKEIHKCTNTADIEGTKVGGIVGTANKGLITGCKNTGKVTGTLAGGIAAQENGTGAIVNCDNLGVISGSTTGGIVGETNGTGTLIDGKEGVIAITGCTNKGAIAGNPAGGIVGKTNGAGAITDCGNEGNINHQSDAVVGGIVGEEHGTGKIVSCTNSGAIVGATTGGIVGSKIGTNEIFKCENTGAVSGDTTGGIVGAAGTSKIIRCKNAGTIQVTSGNNAMVGGIAGSGKYVEECSNSGEVKGRSDATEDNSKCGGIVGFMHSSAGEIKKCRNSGKIYKGAGICGGEAPYIENCYNDGDTDMGGIAIRLRSFSIAHCYSAEWNDVDLVRVDGNEPGNTPSGREPIRCFYWNKDEAEGSPEPSTKTWPNQQVRALNSTGFSTRKVFENAGWDFDNIWEMAEVTCNDPRVPQVRPVLQWEEYTAYGKKEVDAYLIMKSWTKGETPSEPQIFGHYDTTVYNPWTAYLVYWSKDANGEFVRKGNNKPSEPGEYKLSIDFGSTKLYDAKEVATYFTIYAKPDEQTSLKKLVISIEQPSWIEGEDAKDPIIHGSNITSWAKNGRKLEYANYESVKNDFWNGKYSTTVPKSAGKYVVKVTISADGGYEGGEFYQTFEIRSRTASTVESGRKVPNIYLDMPTAWYYGQVQSNPVIRGDYDHNAVITWSYTDLRNNNVTSSMPTNAGTYRVEARLSETATYIAATADKIFTIYSYEDYWGTGTSTTTVGYALPISNQSVTKVSSSVVGNTVEVATVSESTLNSISGSNSNYNSVLLDASGASARVNRMAIDRSSLNEIYRLMDRKSHINNAVLRFTRGDLELTKTRLARLLSENSGLKFEFSLSEDGTSSLTRSQQSALTMGGILGILEPRLRRVNESGSVKTYDSLNGKDMKVRYTYTIPTGKTIADYEVYGVGTNGSLRQYPLTYQNGQFQFDVQTEDVYVLVLKGVTGGTTTDSTIIDGSGIIEAASSSLALNAEFVVRHRGKSLKVGWGKVGNADCYEIYASRTNRDFDYSKPTKVVTGNKENTLLLTKVGGKKVNPNYNYKVCVYACRNVDGQRVKVFQSLIGYVVGKQNKKYTNTERMTIRQTHWFAEVGDTSDMRAKIYLVDKNKKLVPGYTSKFRYCSSNPEIVSVSKTGKLTAVSPGTCVVYVYAKNGVARKTTIKVS